MYAYEIVNFQTGDVLFCSRERAEEVFGVENFIHILNGEFEGVACFQHMIH